MKRTVGYAAIALFCVGFLLCLIYPTKDYSVSERRELAQFPEVSTKTVLSGTFMSDFEEYAADQFPFREIFRSIKAGFSRYVLQQKDDNGVYVSEGHISKMDGEMNEVSLDRAADRFTYVYEKYMKEKGIVPYLSLVPDKNYFLAENSGHPAYDYEAFSSYIIGKVPYMEYIDLFSVLTKEDYYYTDPHWKQENLVEAAKKIAETMGTSLPEQYAKETLEEPFYGTYYGQYGLPFEADRISYLTNPVLEQMIVTNYENGQKTGVYDLEKAKGDDPYEVFLSGPVSLLTIENPEINSKKELIVFRDSFGSSISPLLAQGYGKVTLIDIRYIHPDQLEKYVSFTDQDVLFLYSTSVLNHSETIK